MEAKVWILLMLVTFPNGESSQERVGTFDAQWWCETLAEELQGSPEVARALAERSTGWAGTKIEYTCVNAD